MEIEAGATRHSDSLSSHNWFSGETNEIQTKDSFQFVSISCVVFVWINSSFYLSSDDKNH